MYNYKNMDNYELIEEEKKSDFRNPEILLEIFDRAEEFEPGIKDEYIRSFDCVNIDSDDIFDRAISYLV